MVSGVRIGRGRKEERKFLYITFGEVSCVGEQTLITKRAYAGVGDRVIWSLLPLRAESVCKVNCGRRGHHKKVVEEITQPRVDYLVKGEDYVLGSFILVKGDGVEFLVWVESVPTDGLSRLPRHKLVV